MTFGSLFAGIGGFDLGFERAGMKCEWQVEIDPYCQRVLAKHWPNVRRWDDVRTFPPAAWVQCDCCENFLCTWHGGHAHDCPEDECPELEVWDYEWGLNPYEQAHPKWKVDVLCGGFPCQDISNAGKREGIDGKQSGLWKQFVRVVRKLRPKIAVVENVGAISVSGLRRVLGDLADSGFDAEWATLPASAFGACHRRDRVFIVAYSPSNGLEGGYTTAGVGEASATTLDHLHDWPELSTPIGLRSRNGFPDFVDRIRGLGNAVVPQVAEWIGRRLMEFQASNKDR